MDTEQEMLRNLIPELMKNPESIESLMQFANKFGGVKK